MILNWSCMGPLEWYYTGGEVRVDGEAIRHVWYVDTDAGIVKSYDVTGDRTPITSQGFAQLGLTPDFEVELPPGGLASRIYHGKVEVKAKGGT